jgi:hypothetical protein
VAERKKQELRERARQIKASGATYRLVYCDPCGGNQLVFERPTNDPGQIVALAAIDQSNHGVDLLPLHFPLRNVLR